MAQLFVSHSSADNALAAEVKDALADLGYGSVFLDFDPTGGLVPGQAWRDQLFTNLDACDAVVFITTPQSVASQWCHSELALTRWLRKPVLALLVDGADPHPLIADLQGLKISAGQIDRDRVRAALGALGLEQEARWDAGRSPFPGLRAFDESYAAVFFGRDRQIDQLRQLVDPPSRSREGAIIPVLGPSGSGKSSLVRAGLVPALRVSDDWVITDPWTPSDVPLAEMSLALAHAAKLRQAELDADRCAELLRTPGGMAEYVRAIRASGQASAETKVLVVVDQAEELVTMTGEAERTAFLQALTTACTAPSPLRVVMTARTDMWDRVAAETGKSALQVAPTVLHVPPLSRSDLAEVISQPARRSHLTLEDGLVQRLVDDTGGGEALPLLAFTLARLAAESQDGRLTHAAYDAIGGVRGAIASRAGEVVTAGRTEQDVAEAVLHLVNLTDATPHKRLARAADVPPRHREILDDLVDARLVVINEVNDQQVYAPAHESLFSAWPPLAALIEKRRDDLVLRARLERRAGDWREGGATQSGLLAGLELAQARAWRSRNPDMGTADVTAYVDASAARQRRGRLVRAGVGLVVAALAVTLVVVLLVNARADRRRAEQARVGELAAIAQRELTHDPAAAAAALLRGLEINGSDRELRTAARTLLRSPARDVYRSPEQDSFYNIGVGGSVGAVTTGAGRALVWDTATERVLDLPESGALAVRPDGRVLVSVDSKAGIHAYDLAADLPAGGTPTPLSTFSPDDGSVPVLAFSHDGSLLAVARTSWVTLWDLRDPAAPRELTSWHSPKGDPTALAVLDDGRVLSASVSSQLVVWNALGDNSTAELVPGRSDSGVQHLTADAAGEHVLIDFPTFEDVALVDVATGTPVGSFRASLPDAPPTGLPPVSWTSSLSPDGHTVATFDLAGRGYVFGAEDGAYLGGLTGGHTSLVSESLFDDDGMLLSASVDGSLRLWDPRSSELELSDDPRADLCRVFGDRIDDDSWRLAFEDDDREALCPGHERAAPPPLKVSSSADIGALPEVAAPGTVVFTDGFDGATPFGTGPQPVSTGTVTASVKGGRYRMESAGLGPDYTAWRTAPVSGAGATWSVRVTPGRTRGACGLYAGDGATQLVVTLDRDSGEGRAEWFSGSGSTHVLPFTAPPGSAGPLALVDDQGVIAVLLGGRRVATTVDPVLRPPTTIGIATRGDTASCDVDDITLTTAP
ncbi:TIR domain-containing protein [Nocardioides anomalus]|uniref:TIR domain-containing protein n=1 Tax=Nocardioides anomalus TaxID=2712223 RepID=A0A6G6WGD4_9ACTN|nr:TIR domain-containing protein [Nocardioides anomalus]QIG44294.1 TIR domain-containing protein [Nocardioides anomalus]